MDITAEHARRLESTHRTGTVAEVNGGLVRIKTGGCITDWLPWPTVAAGHVRQWNPPKVGEQVTLLSESGDLGTARILPGNNSDAIPLPSTHPTEPLTEYPDGAQIAYNWNTGALVATGVKSASIQAANTITVDCPSVHFTGSLTVDGDVTASGISLVDHTHGGVQSGGSSTGAPQ